MTTGHAIASLAEYCLRKGLIQPSEKTWAINTILDILRLDGCEHEAEVTGEIDLAQVLGTLLDDAHERGVLPEDSVVYRDLFDTRLMGALTPRPAQVIEKFRALYAESPERPRTGTTSSARTPTTSAATASPRTSSGKPPRSTASWTSP